MEGDDNLERKIILIILDAFSSNYLRRELCPSLYDASRAHYFSEIEPMFGFQGVGAAIYSGASSNTTGVFAEFVLEKNKIITRSRFLKAFTRLADQVPNDNLSTNARNLLFRLLGKKRHGISNVIPPPLLGYFSPKLKKEFTEEESLGGVQTIFDILREHGMSYELQRPSPRSENAVVDDIISRAKKRRIPDLAVVHPCSLDIIGHDFGPTSHDMKHALADIDRQMHRIINSLKSLSEEIVTIIMSDHGMNPVNKTIDLRPILSHPSLKIGKDYLVFLDSTMARFWFFNDGARKLICDRLSMLTCGQILNESDMEKLEISNIGYEYGEVIFALNEGYVLFPDFFRKHRPPKGMHGYAFPSYDAPILVIHAPNLSENFRRKAVRFIDVAPTVLELLNLPLPPTCEGCSLLA